MVFSLPGMPASRLYFWLALILSFFYYFKNDSLETNNLRIYCTDFHNFSTNVRCLIVDQQSVLSLIVYRLGQKNCF